MANLTNNEMLFVLTVLKNPETEYNANSISKILKISPMGALKIAKKLEEENIIRSKKFGKAKFYNLNFNNDYTKRYLSFLLNREVEQSGSYIKRWANELKKIKNAEAAILFGSVLSKEEKAKDIDVLLIVKKDKFQNIKKEIESINLISKPELHPLYQTFEDLKVNIDKNDKVILNAIKGIVVCGENKIIELLKK